MPTRITSTIPRTPSMSILHIIHYILYTALYIIYCTLYIYTLHYITYTMHDILYTIPQKPIGIAHAPTLSPAIDAQAENQPDPS